MMEYVGNWSEQVTGERSTARQKNFRVGDKLINLRVLTEELDNVTIPSRNDAVIDVSELDCNPGLRWVCKKTCNRSRVDGHQGRQIRWWDRRFPKLKQSYSNQTYHHRDYPYWETPLAKDTAPRQVVRALRSFLWMERNSECLIPSWTINRFSASDLRASELAARETIGDGYGWRFPSGLEYGMPPTSGLIAWSITMLLIINYHARKYYFSSECVLRKKQVDLFGRREIHFRMLKAESISRLADL